MDAVGCPSNAVLAPLVAIGYLVEVPMAVAMVLLAGFIAWGIVDVLRSKTWRGIGRLLLAALTIQPGQMRELTWLGGRRAASATRRHVAATAQCPPSHVGSHACLRAATSPSSPPARAATAASASPALSAGPAPWGVPKHHGFVAARPARRHPHALDPAATPV